ncbi:MAG: SUMF1/EgtB/PvdO family nonheme iron enzyme [Deltaproteobacteria bacterium]|nr:SUMF1/EgtB/PvdO family nonheme iron enzyme [Deltaproteobacteria bacterium]
MKKDDIAFSFKGKMVDIPAGEFMMGDDIPVGPGPLPKETERALPIHRVTLDAFEMGATQVTNAQYCDFLNAALYEEKIVVQKSNAGNGWLMTRVKESVPCWEVTGAESEPYAAWRYIMLSPVQGLGLYRAPEHVLSRSWILYDPNYEYFHVHMGFEDYAVSFVTWYGACAFSEFYGLSLPTEAQWEYAARGGQQLKYPTDDGTMDCSKANYGCNSYNHSLPFPPGGDVGDPLEEDYLDYATPAVTEGNRYPPNPFGLYNMAGNLKELCLDWYDPKFYQRCVDEGMVHNPVNHDGEDPPAEVQMILTHDEHYYEKDVRAMRGAGMHQPIIRTLSASRGGTYPLRANDHHGFRVANNDPGKIPRYK